MQFGGPVGEIDTLLKSDSDYVACPAPLPAIQAISRQIGMTVNVRIVMSKSGVGAILEAARNVIHDWALRLEAAGILGEGLTFSAKEAARAGSVTVNIGSIGNASGIGSFGDGAQISSTQTIEIKEFAGRVRDLVAGAEKALPGSGLPQDVITRAKKQLIELKQEATAQKPDVGKLQAALESLRAILEGAAGNVVAAGVLALIAKALGLH
jgi:hypothetical protein